MRFVIAVQRQYGSLICWNPSATLQAVKNIREIPLRDPLLVVSCTSFTPNLEVLEEKITSARLSFVALTQGNLYSSRDALIVTAQE